MVAAFPVSRPLLRPRETLLPSTVRHRASEGPLSTPPIPTWRSLHCPGPRAPPSAGWGRPRGAGEALPDVLAATLLARRPWRLGEGESSVTSVLESWRMLFPGLGWAGGQQKPLGQARQSRQAPRLRLETCLPCSLGTCCPGALARAQAAQGGARHGRWAPVPSASQGKANET